MGNRQETEFANARLKHLEDAAKLLASESPSVSAFLNSQHDRARGTELSSVRAREACSACGNPMIAGRTCTITIEEHKPGDVGNYSSNSIDRVQKSKSIGPRLKTPSTRKPGKYTIFECKRCFRRTAISGLQVGASLLLAQRQDVAGDSPDFPFQEAVEAQPSQSNTPRPQPASSSANANSRKRAKARKKGGLQSLLEKSQTQSTSSQSDGFGLDLMDFMKSN